MVRAELSEESKKLVADTAAILRHFDADGDQKLSSEELKKLQKDYSEKKLPVELHSILHKRYDKNNDGILQDDEVHQITKDMHLADSKMRYVAYAGRLGKIVRYAAYTSDVGEAFRPVTNVWFVRGCYGLSWMYVIGDVANEAHNDWGDGVRGQLLYQRVTKRTVFQSVASMLLPALTIHQTVHFGKHTLFPKIGRWTKWGPTFLGLGVIPLLPFMYDHPVEWATDKVFNTMWPVHDPRPKKEHHH
jgi:fission process protein 1